MSAMPPPARAHVLMPRAACVLIALLLAAGCARIGLPGPTDGQPDLPPTWRALPRHENSAQIQAFLTRYEPGSRKAEAARFLAENLPPADAAALSADELAEHVDYAFRARMSFPWAASVPWDVFLRWVLPHRSAQEPAQRFRAYLFHELAPRLSSIAASNPSATASSNSTGINKTAPEKNALERAALELALWCQEKLAYVSTQRRDAGPLTVLLRGRARCEEASILYCAAARSVGIPARVVMTPAWQFADDNHAWVEVRIAGQWRYLDPANPAPALDTAWFTDNAANALIVTTTAYGNVPPDGKAPGGEDAQVLPSGPGYTRLNLTPRYTPAHELRVTVLGPDGAPLPNARVGVSIYNYATFTPAAAIDCDANGQGTLLMGKGTVLLTVASGDRADYAIVRVTPGGAEVELDIRRDEQPRGTALFSFGERLTAPRPQISEGRKMVFADRKQAAGTLREARLAHARSQALNMLEGLSFDPAQTSAANQTQIQQQLSAIADKVVEEAGGNAPGLAAFLRSVPPRSRVLAVSMLAGLWAADRAVPADPEAWRRELIAAQTARENAAKTLGLKLSDAVYNEIWPFLVTHRVTRYEPHCLYFSKLGKRFGHLARGDAQLTAWNVAEYTSRLALVRGHALGPLLTPVQAVRLGAVSSELERAIACVAILRSLGVPARHYEQWELTEFFDGAQWRPVYPDRPELTGNAATDKATAPLYAPPAELDIRFTLDNAPAGEDEIKYYRDYTISTLRPRRAGDPPLFRFREPDNRFFNISFDPSTGEHKLLLPAGKYFLIGGRRAKTGTPLVHIEPVAPRSGMTSKAVAPMDALP